MVEVLLALVGFIVAAVVAAGTVAFATELMHGRTFRIALKKICEDVLSRAVLAR